MVEQKQINILDKAVLVSLRLGKLGVSKKVPDGLQGVVDATGNTPRIDGAADHFRVNKTILDSPELKMVQSFDSEIRGYIKRMCFPSLIVEGVHIAPLSVIGEVVQTLEQMRETRRGLVDKFLAVYEDRIAEASTILGANFKQTDYKSLQEAAEEFVMEWRIVTLGVPDKLQEFAPELYGQEVEKSHQSIQDMADGVRDRTRATFRTHIDTLVLRLDGERAPGVCKIFRNSIIENAVAFLQQYKRAFADLVEDAELTRLIDSALDVLTEVSPDDLRQSKELRENVVAGLREIQDALDAMGVHAAKEQQEAA
jgi:hypothetical protein